MKVFRIQRSRENFRLYKIAEAKPKNGIKKIKKEKYKEFCQAINKSANPTYIWKITKRFKNRWNNTGNANEFKPERVDGAKKLIQDLCTDWCSPLKPDLNNHPSDPFLDEPFTQEEFDYAMSSVNLKSSPGLDGIDYQILTQMSRYAKSVLLDIFNSIYAYKIYPNEWKQILVHFVPKQGTDKVRPISLSSCPLKVFERMISNRLTWWLEHYEKMPKTQNGFRCGRSCTDNLATLLSDIVKAFNEDKVVAAVFLDIIGAYNEVLPDILIYKLIDLGIPECLLSFIYKMVSSRHLTFKFGNIHECHWTFRGVPQGGVLSPLLYAIYQSELKQNQICVLQFADDVVFYKISAIVFEAVYFANEMFKKYVKYLKNFNFDVSYEKTNFVVFSNKPAMKRETFQLKIEDRIIESSDYVKFLGMYLHKSLNWDIHTNNVVKRCDNALKIINCLRTTWWGADVMVLINIFKSPIQSRIDYGSFLMNDLTIKQVEKLEKIIFKALSSAMGYRMSTPKNVILAETKVMPFLLRSEYLGYRYLRRVASF